MKPKKKRKPTQIELLMTENVRLRSLIEPTEKELQFANDRCKCLADAMDEMRANYERIYHLSIADLLLIKGLNLEPRMYRMVTDLPLVTRAVVAKFEKLKETRAKE